MAITLENSFCRYVIGNDGRNLHVVDKASGTDYALSAPPSRCAYVMQSGRRHDATSAALEDGRLRLGFGESGVAACVRIDTHPGYFVYTVESVTGDADELVFIHVPTSLRVKADEPFSASVIALNLQANVEALPGPQQQLWGAAYARFGFSGSQAGLVTAPFSEMREIMKEMVGEAPGVPHSPYGGPWAMDADITYGSYLFGAPSADTVDGWIALCKELGFTQIDFCGCLNYGDYQPFPHMYPDGYAGVKAVTDRLHDAGILAGLHTMSFSISKQCDWVTPIPDPRLAKERTYTLADGIGAEDTSVPLLECTDDLPRFIGYYVRRSMTLQIDDELIEYTAVADGSSYAVTGCKRGACGTRPSPHSKGAKAHHLKQCWGCFVPDGESTLFGDVANRIASVINQCGFDFTYLDGLDGAHVIGGEEGRWHYGAKFAFEVYSRLERPIMMEMATFHHHLWFVRSRMQAWDHTIRAHKRFIDIHCHSNDGARRMFMPLHLGWSRVLASLGHEHEATYLDDVEYMWCKGIGTDAGYSLQSIDPAMFAKETWLKELAPVIKTYETLRQEHYFPETVKAKLREPGSEYMLRSSRDGEWEFLPVGHARHKVEAIDGNSNVWDTENRFGPQPLKLRIEPLMVCGDYDGPDTVDLASFAAADEFAYPEPSRQILNSGKLYEFAAAAPGLSAEIRPSADHVKVGAVSGCWTAVNTGSAELVMSSAPGDEYSLLDHAERIHRPRAASWVRLRKTYSAPLDLTKYRGMGFWIYGDGQGELVNVSLTTRASSDTELDHYVPVDFTGWRYVELVEPEGERFDDYSWPYGRCLYKVYREIAAPQNTLALTLWYNNVPVGGRVACWLSPIRALPLMPQKMVRPTVSVGGRTVVFPVEIETGQYLEMRGPEDCKLYSAKGEFLAAVQPEGEIPDLEPGANEITFGCVSQDCRSRANVTILTEGDTPLRR